MTVSSLTFCVLLIIEHETFNWFLQIDLKNEMFSVNRGVFSILRKSIKKKHAKKVQTAVKRDRMENAAAKDKVALAKLTATEPRFKKPDACRFVANPAFVR